MASKKSKKALSAKSAPTIVRIHRPDLTSEERERKMKQLEQATIDIVLAAEQAHAARMECKSN